MRIRLTCNGAGDMRLVTLPDTKAPCKISAPTGAALVCSNQLQEMTTTSQPGSRAGYGKLPQRISFTRYGRAQIRQAGAVLDDGDRRNAIFLTGTLPGGSERALRALAEWSGWLVQSLKQWLHDRAPGCVFFGVWEWQRRGALHLHFAVRTETARQADTLRRIFKARWIRLLDSICKRSGVDVFEKEDGSSWKDDKWVTRTDAQRVEKSVGCYLAKYLSKGSNKTRKRCAFPPSAWYFCSQTARKEIVHRLRSVEVAQLHLGLALDLFERLGAVVVAQDRAAFAYTSPVNTSVKGLIGLLRPIEARMLFDDLAGMLRVLQIVDISTEPDIPLSPELITRMFGGKQIRVNTT